MQHYFTMVVKLIANLSDIYIIMSSKINVLARDYRAAEGSEMACNSHKSLYRRRNACGYYFYLIELVQSWQTTKPLYGYAGLYIQSTPLIILTYHCIIICMSPSVQKHNYRLNIIKVHGTTHISTNTTSTQCRVPTIALSCIPSVQKHTRVNYRPT